MISASELRIGNIVSQGGKPKIVSSITHGNVIGLSEPDDYYYVGLLEGVDLSPDWLEKAGFVKFKTDIYDNGRLRVWNGLAYLKHEDTNDAYYIPNSIHFVHQLQNIFFSLIGHELEIKI